MNKRKLYFVALFTVFMLFGVGCSKKNTSQESVELLFWHTFGEGAEIESFNEVVTDFEIAYPDIKINSVRMPFDGLQQQIITAVAGGVAPDVMRMDPTWIGKMASMGALISLDDLVDFNTVKNNALAGPLSSSLLNGKYYGLPLGTNTTVAIWNMDLLESLNISTPPSTIEEVEKLAELYNDPKDEKYFFTIAGTHTWAMLPWFWSLGGKLTDPEFRRSSGYLDSQASIQALNKIASWYQNGIISPAIIGEQPDAWAASTSGNLPLVSDGPWFFTSVETSFKKQATILPEGDGGSVSVVGGEGVVMLEGTKYKEESWVFMQYLMSDEAQLKMAKAGVIPATQTALSLMNTDENEFLGAFIEQLETAQSRIPSENYIEIDNLLGQVFERVIRGDSTAEELLPEVAKTIDTLL